MGDCVCGAWVAAAGVEGQSYDCALLLLFVIDYIVADYCMLLVAFLLELFMLLTAVFAFNTRHMMCTQFRLLTFTHHFKYLSPLASPTPQFLQWKAAAGEGLQQLLQAEELDVE